MAQNLPPIANWEQISTNIVRILGGNPSKVRLYIYIPSTTLSSHDLLELTPTSHFSWGSNSSRYKEAIHTY